MSGAVFIAYTYSRNVFLELTGNYDQVYPDLTCCNLYSTHNTCSVIWHAWSSLYAIIKLLYVAMRLVVEVKGHVCILVISTTMYPLLIVLRWLPLETDTDCIVCQSPLAAAGSSSLLLIFMIIICRVP